MKDVLIWSLFILAGISGSQNSIAADLGHLNSTDNCLQRSNWNHPYEVNEINFIKPHGVVLGEVVLRPIIDFVSPPVTSFYNFLSYSCSYAWNGLNKFTGTLNQAISFPGAEASMCTSYVENETKPLAELFASAFSASSTQGADNGCVYLPPTNGETGNFFREMVIKSNNPELNFKDVLAEIAGRQESLHRFQFYYPLENEEHANKFFQVAEIKAQKAHLFVPVFAECQFLHPRHRGFLREAHIKNGPTIYEHALIDPALKTIIFVEEEVRLSGGQLIEGSFTAVNSVIEKDGKWYFAGLYLYDRPFSEHDVENSRTMFKETYENMARFIEDGRLAAEYQGLRPY